MTFWNGAIHQCNSVRESLQQLSSAISPPSVANFYQTDNNLTFPAISAALHVCVCIQNGFKVNHFYPTQQDKICSSNSDLHCVPGLQLCNFVHTLAVVSSTILTITFPCGVFHPSPLRSYHWTSLLITVLGLNKPPTYVPSQSPHTSNSQEVT